MLIDGKVIRSSDMQFRESQKVSVAPVTAHQDVIVSVPTPQLSNFNNVSNDDDDDVDIRERVFNDFHIVPRAQQSVQDVQSDVHPDVHPSVRSASVGQLREQRMQNGLLPIQLTLRNNGSNPESCSTRQCCAGTSAGSACGARCRTTSSAGSAANPH